MKTKIKHEVKRPKLKDFKLSIYTKEELEDKRSKAWKPIL
jgi:hypothetical protein